MRAIVSLLVAGALVMGSGCASIGSTVAAPEPYGGVRIDARHVGCGVPVVTAISIADIVPSAVLDTLVLPYTLPASVVRQKGATPESR